MDNLALWSTALAAFWRLDAGPFAPILKVAMHTHHPNDMSRRQALKTLGAGAALVGLAGLAGKTFAQEPPGAQPFTLPPLGYAYDALEPHIDAKTMEIHHTKHHQAYLAAANKALEGRAELLSLGAVEVLKKTKDMPGAQSTALRNNVGGHLNHAHFWKIIAPGGEKTMSGPLAEAITRDFGGENDFKRQFADAAMKRFGSGWAWLCANGSTLVIKSTANQDSPLSEGLAPIIGLDVWEHAYYLNYQNRRTDYVSAFWNVLNWSQAGANFTAAVGG
jgi:Fe-Mn family superoxide dismutase